MSRYETLLEKYQDGEETAEEAVELARLVREDPGRAASFYDALLLEADLYDSYAGIAQIRAASRRRRMRLTPRVLVVWAAAVLMMVLLAVLLRSGRPSPEKVRETGPVAPRSPEPPPVLEEEEEDDDHGSKKDEVEREYRKGLREVERKRLEGSSAEAEKKLREIEREREKKLRELKRRQGDR